MLVQSPILTTTTLIETPAAVHNYAARRSALNPLTEQKVLQGQQPQLQFSNQLCNLEVQTAAISSLFPTGLEPFAACPGIGFEQLPLELRVKIFRYLNVPNLMKAARVCRSWRDLAYNGALWSHIDATPFYKTIPAEQLLMLGVAAGGFLRVANFRGCVQLQSHALRTLAECCGNIQILHLSGCRSPSAASIAYLLRHLRDLLVLDVSGLNNINNYTLFTIAASCPRLERLNLAWCRGISSRGVEAVLRGCSRLRWLRLDGCITITDEMMLENFCAPPELRFISLASTHVQDRGIEALAKQCPKLVHLNLSGCRITDHALRQLALHCPNLERLELAECRALTDEGFTFLALRCPNIHSLDLENCIEITDRTLQAFAGLRRLSRLCLSYCENITDEGVASVLRGCRDTLTAIELDNCASLTDSVLQSAGALLGQCLPPPLTPTTSLAPSEVPPSPRSSSTAKRRRVSIEVYDCRSITLSAVLEAQRTAPILSVKSYYTWHRRPSTDEDDAEGHAHHFLHHGFHHRDRGNSCTIL
ncbi:uncharacterized protein VTP21DRAFT_3555 [Calcarisporiella thermophila]|uniref:uncharacterized protein n=1 Tax=Calcarisporiella thermophila TaxID=911321 RepID=UPI003742E125